VSASRKSEKRDVIPRWRRSRDIATFADSVSPRVTRPFSLTVGIERQPLDVLADFSDSGKPLIWAEALSMALADHDFDDAIAIVKQRKNLDLTRFPLLDEAAQNSYIERLRTGPPHHSPSSLAASGPTSDMRIAREAVRVYESNALAWLDLGRAHAINGNLDQAERAIWTALHFDHDTRWIVRAAARFFIHREDMESGLAVLERAAGYRSDPWIVSAHVAVSHAMNKTSPLMRRARSLFEDDNFRPKHVSELGMALATVELGASLRPSRTVNRLGKRSLRDPTENAVAQAEWIESKSGKAFGDLSERLRTCGKIC